MLDEERVPEERELPIAELSRPLVVPDDLNEELLPELRVAADSRDERPDELRSDEEVLRPLLAAEDLDAVLRPPLRPFATVARPP